MSSSRSIVCHALARSERSSCGGRALAIAAPPAVLDDAAEVGHLAQVRPGHGKRRQRRGDELEVERRGAADLGGQLDGARIAGEAALLLPAGAQVGTGCRRAATGRARRGCGARGRRRGRWRDGAAPGWRSGRWWWRRSRRRAWRRARRGRRCGPSRAGRRGPTARRGRGRARTPRSGGRAGGPPRPARRRRVRRGRRPCGSR